MAPFATTDDLASRWRELSATEEPVAETLLGDAAVWLRQWFPGIDAQVASGVLDALAPIMVSCAMVKRAMLASGNEGVANAQHAQTYGPFTSQTGMTYKNPEGNLYITEQEQELLTGTTSGAVSMVCDGL